MSYIGDFRLGETFDTKFCTVTTTGAPTTLAGTPVISAYVGNSTTEITAGITLTVDFDARTGLNNVRVVATSGNGYATASNYQLVITTGTVGGTSVVGYVVAEFSIENRSALMPTTAARTLDVTATGEAGLDWANVAGQGTTVNLSATTTNVVNTATAVTTVNGLAANVITATSINADAITAAKIAAGAIDADALAADAVTEIRSLVSGTADSGSTTTMVDAARTEADTDYWKGCWILFTSGTIANQVRLITAFTPGTDTITFAPATTQAVGTNTYEILSSGAVDIGLISTDEAAANNAELFFDNTGFNASASAIGTVNSVGTGAITSSSFAAGATALANGTADSGTTTTMVDAARTEADTDYWKGAYILFTSGTCVGQCRQITAFTPGTDTITFAPATTQAVGTNTYEILASAAVDVRLWNGTAPNNLVSGRVDSDVGAMQANTVTASAIATDAIDADAIAANAIGASEIANGAIDAATFAAGAIDAAALAADAGTEIGTAVWATATRTITGGAIDTNNDKTGYSIGVGGIASTAFAAGAIDATAVAANAIGASELATDAVAEIADGILNRNIAGGSDGGRDVQSALYALRNKTAIAAGTLTVYQTDDVTPEFTATVATTAGDPISSIDPA